jgi:hypothetical protein
VKGEPVVGDLEVTGDAFRLADDLELDPGANLVRDGRADDAKVVGVRVGRPGPWRP